MARLQARLDNVCSEMRYRKRASETYRPLKSFSTSRHHVNTHSPVARIQGILLRHMGMRRYRGYDRMVGLLFGS